MSANSSTKPALFAASMRWAGPTLTVVNKSNTVLLLSLLSLLIGLLAALLSLPVYAQDNLAALDPSQATQARELVAQAARSIKLEGARVEVQLGQLDPRLRLAPCRRTEAYLPAGQRALGRTRVGLRCLEGTTLWNVTLPVTVSLFAPGIVASEALAAGTVLNQSHLKLAEIDWGVDAGRAHADIAGLLGRELSRPLGQGHAVVATDLKTRQWFAAGETVQVLARGAGYQVSTDGLALSHGLEGQPVRVRTSSGRVLTGRATADRLVEVVL